MTELPRSFTQFPDRDFLLEFDGSSAELRHVNSFVDIGDLDAARTELVNHFRKRRSPHWLCDLRDGRRGEVRHLWPSVLRPDIEDFTARADHALRNILVMSPGMELRFGRDLDWVTPDTLSLFVPGNTFKCCPFMRDLAIAHAAARGADPVAPVERTLHPCQRTPAPRKACPGLSLFRPFEVRRSPLRAAKVSSRGPRRRLGRRCRVGGEFAPCRRGICAEGNAEDRRRLHMVTRNTSRIMRRMEAHRQRAGQEPKVSQSPLPFRLRCRGRALWQRLSRSSRRRGSRDRLREQQVGDDEASAERQVAATERSPSRTARAVAPRSAVRRKRRRRAGDEVQNRGAVENGRFRLNYVARKPVGKLHHGKAHHFLICRCGSSRAIYQTRCRASDSRQR